MGGVFEIDFLTVSGFLSEQGLEVIADYFFAAVSHLSKGQCVLCSDTINS